MKDHNVAQPAEPHPAHIATLIAAERAAPPVDAALRERLLTRIEASVALPAPVAAAAVAAKGLGALKILTAVLAIGGTATWALWPAANGAPSPTTASSRTTPTTPVLEAGPGIPAPPEIAQAPSAPVDLPPAPSDVPGLIVTKPPGADDEPSVVEPPAPPRATATAPKTSVPPTGPEHQYISTARAALKDGDLPAARRALAIHRRAFPGGLLAEEREALTVRIAFVSDKLPEARQLRDRFRRNYPSSYHLRGLDELGR